MPTETVSAKILYYDQDYDIYIEAIIRFDICLN
jgi:hypothetical protein